MNIGMNLLAVIVAALSAFALGGLWYSKFLFGKIWMREAGITEEKMQACKHPKRVFGIAFILSLVSAFTFALFLGPQPPMLLAVMSGFLAGLCWVATSFGINYLFAQRSLKLFLIDGGYYTLQFTLYGVILGLWQ